MKHANKLKLISLILAMILLLSSCSFIDSFFGEEPEEPEAPGDELSLADYKVIASRYFSGTMSQKISEFQYAVEMTTGVKLLKETDTSRSAIENDDPEIVLGPTSRTQSDKALEELDGKSGWVIKRIGKKILINGSSDYMISLGVDYFLANCLTGERLAEGVIAMSDGYVQKNTNIGTVYLFGGTGATNLSVVYSQNLDTDEHHTYGDDATHTTDYLYDEATKFRDELAKLSGKTVSIASDKSTAGTDTVEVLFGDTNRSATDTIKEKTTAYQYGVYCLGSQVALFGWTESTVMQAKSYFTSLVEYCREYKSGFVRFPTKVPLVLTASQFASDVPQLSSGTFEGAEDSGSGTLTKDTASGTLLQCYADVPKLDYDAYCTTLKKAGYTLYATNQNTNTETNRTNYFNTYISTTNMVHVYYVAKDATKGDVRVVTAKLENINLPNATEQSYKKVADTQITQMRLAYAQTNFGLCYIVTLEDGSFIVFDGGGDRRGGFESYDHVRLHTILSGLYKDIFGKDPSTSDPIVIAAWVLTHQHWDHYAGFRSFCQSYCQGETADVKLEQYICNLGSYGYIYNTYNPDGYGVKNLITLSEGCLYPYKIVEAHTGQMIYVRNVVIEILYTQEDMYPLPLEYYNNTSMVMRFHMRVSTASKGSNVTAYQPNEQTALFLGDLHYQGDLRLRTMYGGTKKATAFLKSDICQVAHHGYNGCSQELYDIVDPSILLWPSDMGNYNSFLADKTYSSSIPANGTTYNYRAINRWLVTEEKSGRWVIAMADKQNYTIRFPFIFTKGKTLSDMVAMGQIHTDIVESGKDWYNPTT